MSLSHQPSGVVGQGAAADSEPEASAATIEFVFIESGGCSSLGNLVNTQPMTEGASDWFVHAPQPIGKFSLVIS